MLSNLAPQPCRVGDLLLVRRLPPFQANVRKRLGLGEMVAELAGEAAGSP